MYLDKCLDIISNLDYFSISHVSRQDNWLANKLAQQASGYHVDRGMFFIADTSVLVVASSRETREEAGLVKPADDEGCMMAYVGHISRLTRSSRCFEELGFIGRL